MLVRQRSNKPATSTASKTNAMNHPIRDAALVAFKANPKKTQQKKCIHPACGKIGHVESECWVKHPEAKVKKGAQPKNGTTAMPHNPAARLSNCEGNRTLSSPKKPHPCKPTSKPASNRCSFLELPAELRNQIYEHVFPPETVALRPNSPIDKQHPFKTHHGKPPITLQCTRVMGKQHVVVSEFVRWRKSISALVLTCRKVFVEAAPYLYANTTFFFEDPKRIQAFMDIVRPEHLAFITNIRLYCNTYGSPNAFNMGSWETAHLTRWTQVCQSLASKLPSITSLHITISLNKVQYLRFPSRGNTWDTAIHHPFAALKPLSSLSTVTIRVLDRDWSAALKRKQINLQNFCDPESPHPIWAVAAADIRRFIGAPPTHLHKRRVHARYQQHLVGMQKELAKGLAMVVKGHEVEDAMTGLKTAQKAWVEFQEQPALTGGLWL
ncbi:hypothetical protein H2203_000994 [Taxawa tesnikishii (nom. ined.)]|nr:hypothetical protein H2203_000994 [Dothideales sp. JES 119]